MDPGPVSRVTANTGDWERASSMNLSHTLTPEMKGISYLNSLQLCLIYEDPGEGVSELVTLA